MNEKTKTEHPRFRPSLTFYHPNAKGSGSAVKMELRPATDSSEGCLFLTIAKQLTVRNVVDDKVQYPKFDWDRRICVKLCFDDLCQILQVLRGGCEALNSGKGLCHKSGSSLTFIKLRHVLEPNEAFCFEVSRAPHRAEEPSGANSHQTGRFNFSQSEATGLCEVIASSMALICFGYPATASQCRKDSDEHAA